MQAEEHRLPKCKTHRNEYDPKLLIINSEVTSLVQQHKTDMGRTFNQWDYNNTGRMVQLLRHETSCFEPPRSGSTRVQFPVKVKL